MKKVRKPAVAGSFYPSSPQELRDDIGRYLSDAKANAKANDDDTSEPKSNIIIAPHAGYVFSAPVAARAYHRIPADIKTAVIIGPSHHEWFEGVHITDADEFETPLGTVRVNKEITARLLANPLCRNVKGADAKEHCIEVHIPFLQVLLDDFTIVPMLTGRVDPKELADILISFFSDDTVIIASSDLSHFLSQDHARRTDDATVATILSGDPGGFMEGCGETAMRAAMRVAAAKGLSPELLDARTSYETASQYGGANRVVGYAAIAYVKT